MSQLPIRSLRLRSYTTADLDRLSGEKGAVFYDGELKTLKIYNGSGQTAGSVAVIRDGARLELGTTLGVIYANQTTGQITIGDYLGPNGAPAAPSTVISLGGDTNVFQISSYGSPSRTWTFGKNGSMTFPDATVQTTAWTGVADYRNLTNKPEIPEAYSFSVAADDSTQRAISNNELIKFTGAGTVTTASDAEGNITITGATPSSLVNGANTVSLESDGELTVPGPISGLGNNKLEFTANLGSVFSGSNGNTISIYADDGDIGSSADINIYTDTTGNSYKWTFDTDGSLTIPGDIRSDSNINIDINLSDSTLRRWQFGEDGALTLPSVGKISNSVYEWTFGSTGNTTFPTGLTLGAPRGVGTVNFTAAVDKEFQIETGTATSSRLWQFGTDGSLIIPGDVKSNGNINIDINLADSTLRRWSFGEDGQLTFPDGTNQTTAFTGIPGPYANDAAAASGGVAVGSPYHKTGTSGQVFVRLS